MRRGKEGSRRENKNVIETAKTPGTRFLKEKKGCNKEEALDIGGKAAGNPHSPVKVYLTPLMQLSREGNALIGKGLITEEKGKKHRIIRGGPSRWGEQRSSYQGRALRRRLAF